MADLAAGGIEVTFQVSGRTAFAARCGFSACLAKGQEVAPRVEADFR